MTFLLTGATGFLGMELVVRAVAADRADADIVCVIRADDDAHAARRLRDTLITLYGDDIPAAAARRLTAVAGHLERPGLGLSPVAAALVDERVTRIVHSAASISFDLPLDAARAVNVDGTAHVLEIARRLHDRGRLERHLHVSTAYVAGRHDGVVAEDDRTHGAPRNTYEQTKREAEALVARATADGLPTAVVRPSIIVGDSRTGWTPAFNVLYWPLQALSRGLLSSVPADQDGLVDVVPVDYVADAIAHLAGTETPVDGTYHLTAGTAAPRVEGLLDLACATLACPRPSVAPPVRPGHADGAGDHDAGVYLPYFDVRSQFDDTRARAVLAPAAVTCPALTDYFDVLMRYAHAARWGKGGVPRTAASAPDAATAVGPGVQPALTSKR